MINACHTAGVKVIAGWLFPSSSRRTNCDGQATAAVRPSSSPISTHPELAEAILEPDRNRALHGDELTLQTRPEVHAKLVGLESRVCEGDQTLVARNGQPAITAHVERRKLLRRRAAVYAEN